MQLWSINWNVIKIQLLPVLQQLSESVTSVQGGVIATQGFDEIVCSTYAGQNDLRIYFNFFIYLKKVKYNWMCMYAIENFNVIQKKIQSYIKYSPKEKTSLSSLSHYFDISFSEWKIHQHKLPGMWIMIFLYLFLSTDVYLYHFINFTKRKTLEFLAFFGHFTDCCWMILGWISALTSEPNIKESGPDVYHLSDQGREKIIGLR